jgi:hypothetical protein
VMVGMDVYVLLSVCRVEERQIWVRCVLYACQRRSSSVVGIMDCAFHTYRPGPVVPPCVDTGLIDWDWR